MSSGAARTWLATWAVPAVAIVIAVSQVVVASTSPLSPWKGGGFGMFSTIDDPPSRTPRAHVTTTEGTVPLDMRDFRDVTRGAQRAFLDARAFPEPRRLTALLDEVCAHRWEMLGARATPTERRPDPGPAPCRDGLRIDGLRPGVTATHLHLEVLETVQHDGGRRVSPRTLATADTALGAAS